MNKDIERDENMKKSTIFVELILIDAIEEAIAYAEEHAFTDKDYDEAQRYMELVH